MTRRRGARPDRARLLAAARRALRQADDATAFPLPFDFAGDVYLVRPTNLRLVVEDVAGRPVAASWGG